MGLLIALTRVSQSMIESSLSTCMYCIIISEKINDQRVFSAACGGLSDLVNSVERLRDEKSSPPAPWMIHQRGAGLELCRMHIVSL